MNRILLVDDDENLLQGCRRVLLHHYDVSTASSPREALGRMEGEGPFAAVVSDLRMAGDMDGIAFLERVRQASPETVRLMLTGFAEMSTAIRAVNQGHVFRFLTKPCPVEELSRALEDALREHGLARLRWDSVETRLRDAQRMELAAQCAAGVSRDLKSLLGSISDHAEAATGRHVTPQERAAILSDIRAGAAHAARLTKQLAGLTRERSDADFRPVFVRELLEDLAWMLGHVLSSRIQITVRCSAELKPVRGEDAWLRQALLNIALNARDAMPQGGRLTFEARPVERVRPPETGRACRARFTRISIHDTGGGMSAPVIEKLFTPLFSTKDDGRRLGFGMSVTREVIRAHGGWIAAESLRKDGSTFHVFLPEWTATPGRP